MVYASVMCNEAVYAAPALEALRDRRVEVYAEGKEAWIEAALPVEHGDDDRVPS